MLQQLQYPVPEWFANFYPRKPGGDAGKGGTIT